VTVSNSTFSYSLPGLSVVTFVGQAVGNTAPVLAQVSDRTINAGVTLVVTNVATDAEAPAQTLTFSLLNNNPTNATLNATSGILTWRPLVSQADTTNLFTIKVADDGTPSLSATNSFTVTVNPLAQPGFASISSEAGVGFVLTGDAGPDYTLLTSTNLIDWEALFTTNPPALPFSVMDTNRGDTQRFYRLQLGP
jgi:hypothetical protein